MRRAGPAGDITRMTLLGLLASKPMYGYELRQQMKGLDMEHWVDIRPGSIYSALPRMAAAGFLEITDVAHQGNRPQKTVYGITSAGRAELLKLLRDAWARPAGMAQPVDVALFFVWFLPPAEVATLLVERISVLDNTLALIASNRERSFEAMASGAVDVPPQYVEMMTDLLDHAREVVQTERDWSERTRQRVARGIFDFAPPDSEEATHAPGG
jgi:DNA-binding PadR family transcriptional regulator